MSLTSSVISRMLLGQTDHLEVVDYFKKISILYRDVNNMNNNKSNHNWWIPNEHITQVPVNRKENHVKLEHKRKNIFFTEKIYSWYSTWYLSFILKTLNRQCCSPFTEIRSRSRMRCYCIFRDVYPLFLFSHYCLSRNRK